ncbi:hypothetical protein [Algibacter sp. 2305UL17-15]|uniref:hypothetical protein n=1 Tax=Algibacter sp. 2305UL17-15 TaxID=3231268 RepID=UPI003457EBF0
MKKAFLLILAVVLISCGSKKKHVEFDPKKSKNQVPQIDPNSLIQIVTRDSYKESVADLKHQAEKVKAYNDQKKAIRDELNKIRKETDQQIELISYLTELEGFQNALLLVLSEKTHAKHRASPKKRSTSYMKRNINNLTENL